VVSVNEACPASPFLSTYRGVTVGCAKFGEDYSAGEIVPVRGDAPANPQVPADAVTASASGLDPEISPAYARIQAARVAQARGVSVDQVRELIADHTRGRTLGFIGEPGVNVLQLNSDLDRSFEARG
jgi:K+-transporting ATPase ATPase C chain